MYKIAIKKKHHTNYRYEGTSTVLAIDLGITNQEIHTKFAF